jgi:predicted nucleotidyltransferase
VIEPEKEKAPPISSSVPQEFAPVQRGLFIEVLNLLNALGTPFAVSGAFALHRHTGIWRDTKDLDIFMVDDQVHTVLDALSSKGFVTEVRDPVWLSKVHLGEYYVDFITGMSNAVLSVQQDWIEHATLADILGIQVKVLAAEELIASKLFVTRRERFDGADIVHVIYGVQGKLDWDRILRLVGSHWMVLLWTLVLYQYIYPAHSEYVPRSVWSDLLSRLRHELDHPDPNAAFKGSLIDERMFAIDVNEWGMADLNRQLRGARTPLPRKEDR